MNNESAPEPRTQEQGRYHVVISNVYADDNRGGAALTEAAIVLARSALPGCHIALVAVSGDEGSLETTHRHTRSRFPDIEILPPAVQVKSGRLSGLRAAARSTLLLWGFDSMGEARTVRYLREADIVIGKGGQAFSSRRGIRGLLGLWLALFPLTYAKSRNIPSSLFGVTIGPYQPKQSAGYLAGWLLRRVDTVLVRDGFSLAEAKRLGVSDTNVIQVPDSVFILQPPSEEEVTTISRDFGLDSVSFGVVTIGVKSGTSDEELVAFLSGVIAELLDRGAVDQVVIVLQVDGIVSSDRRVSEALVKSIDDSRVWLIDKDFKPEQLIALYAGADFMIGCRLHSTIFSIIGGTPAFPISRQSKVKALSIFSTLGLNDYVISFDRQETLGNNPYFFVAEMIQEAVLRAEDSKTEMLEAAARARHGQGIYVEALRSLIGQPNPPRASSPKI